VQVDEKEIVSGHITQATLVLFNRHEMPLKEKRNLVSSH